MKYLKSIELFILITLSAVVLCTPAYSNELPQGINEFVHSYLSAAKQNDVEKLETLTHNAFIKCSEKSEKDNYTQVLDQQIKAFGRQDPIMKIKYKAYTAEELKKINRKLDEMNKKWPVEPEGVIVIMYASFHKVSKQILTVAKETNDWKWVHFCEKEQQQEAFGWMGGDEENF